MYNNVYGKKVRNCLKIKILYHLFAAAKKKKLICNFFIFTLRERGKNHIDNKGWNYQSQKAITIYMIMINKHTCICGHSVDS